MRVDSAITRRLEALDAARGLAIALMVLSHTVKGLLSFKMMPALAIVPIHLVTKFSSSLFIIVFGLSMAVAYGARADSESWPEVRRGLWKRALIILLWYKLLTVVQMFERYEPDVIIDTLLWRRFPDFAEILHFYAWMVLILSFLLPTWRRLNLWHQLGLAWTVGLIATVISQHAEFGGVWQLKAILVEHRGAFCFGILTRGSLVLFALTLGQWVWQRPEDRAIRTSQLGTGAVVFGLCALSFFVAENFEHLDRTLTALAKNFGKHPPRLVFMSFSIGGALLLLGVLVKVEPLAHAALRPLRALGRHSLFCFNAHLLILFLGFRWLFGLRHDVSYAGALALTGVNLAVCGFGAVAWERFVKTRKTRHVEDRYDPAPALGDDEPATEVVAAVGPHAAHRFRR